MYTRTSWRIPHKVFTVNKYNVFRTVAGTSKAMKNDKSLKTWKEIPGPSSLPVIGPLLNYIPGGSYFNIHGRPLMVKLHERYGPIVRLDAMLGLEAMIFIYDPESAAKILRQENTLPRRPGLYSLDYYRRNVKDKRKPDGAIGLLTNQGESWKQVRSTVSPVMMQPKTIRLYDKALDEVALEMIDRIKLIRDGKNMIRNKFDYQMNLWALESVGVVAFGSRLGCFSADLPEDSPVRRLIKCVHDIFAVAVQLDDKANIWRYISTPTYRKGMKLYEEHENLSKYFIQNAIDNMASKPKSEDEEKSILEKLLELDEDVAHVMACDMLLAGIDTTANTIMATLYLLAVNQDKQTKLRTELKLNSDRKYLKACVKESLRMMPVVSGNARVTTKKHEVLGYTIPKNTRVTILHSIMSMTDNHFPRPNEYIPERWIVDQEDPLCYKTSHPFVYNPFGFGVRACIGRRIAELQVETLVARIFENFQVEWTGPPPTVLATTISYVKEPFNYIFNDIQSK